MSFDNAISHQQEQERKRPRRKVPVWDNQAKDIKITESSSRELSNAKKNKITVRHSCYQIDITNVCEGDLVQSKIKLNADQEQERIAEHNQLIGSDASGVDSSRALLGRI